MDTSTIDPLVAAVSATLIAFAVVALFVIDLLIGHIYQGRNSG